jgi:hypothetical protein
MFPGGVDAFEPEMLADFLKGGNDPFALLMFLEEGVYLCLTLSEAVHAEEQYCNYLQYSTKSYSQAKHLGKSTVFAAKGQWKQS